jgi:hypothetical protein
MDAQTVREIRKIKAVINLLSDGDRHPGQDQGLVCEAAEEMLTDLEANGSLVELSYYIKRYCDVLDHPDSDAAGLATEINLMLSAIE